MHKEEAAHILAKIDLGSGVAETDNLLGAARVETSVFDDLLADRVDLVPGTKGSGKTALYRIFVDFLPGLLLSDRRVVVAHGVRQRQDTVFLIYRDQFDKLSEVDFVDFWCVYLISIAYEQFIRSDKFSHFFKGCDKEICDFREKYRSAGIPEFEKQRSLSEIIAWVLAVVKSLKPKVCWTPPGDVGQFDFFLDADSSKKNNECSADSAVTTMRVTSLLESLEKILSKINLSIWLMIDQLDELFERRSKTENRALRGLLRTLRVFGSDQIRVKVFLRDDILEQIVAEDGFAALSHVTARRADTLGWSEEQILTLIIRRIFASDEIRELFDVNRELMMTSVEYQRRLFYRIFSDTVHSPPNQSRTLRWIYNHTKDGRGVVTPRDVIYLLTRAFQQQRDEWRRDPQGEADRLVAGPAVIYGLDQLSQYKRTVYLEAEFPHKWPMIKKLVGGGTEYSNVAMRSIYGKKFHQSIDDLVSLGILEKTIRNQEQRYRIPFLYRRGLECTQKSVTKG